jgi:hypothetical protein
MSATMQVQPANLSREMAMKAQTDFMMRGGTYEIALAQHMATGHVQKQYVYREYPKMLYLNPREIEEVRLVDTCDGRKLESREKRTVFDQFVVHSEEEEERVLAGGRSSVELEDERQTLFARARALNIKADPAWSIVRLKREMGDVMDAAPGNEMAKLEAELTNLRKLAAMQKEIEDLRAQLGSTADDPADLRSQLTTLGVTVDKRWGTARLREELDRATAP